MKRALVAIATLLAVSPSSAQSVLDVGIKAGSAWNTSGRYSPGPAGAVTLDVFPYADRSPIGVRVEGMLVAGRHSYVGILPGEDPRTAEPREIDFGYQLTPVAQAAVLIRERPGEAPYRLHAFGGVAFSRFPWMDAGISSENFGPAGGLGLATTILDPNWSIEIGATSRRVQGGLSLMATISLGVLFSPLD